MSVAHDLESYYRDIKKQADKLYPAGINDFRKSGERKSLRQLLDMSKLFCKANPEYLKLTLCIKDLVNRWDSDPLFKKDQILQRHSFVIVNRSAAMRVYKLQDFTGIAALLFDYKSDPDDRIIVIVIDDTLSIRQNLCGILHEVGHYIGCRQRSRSNQVDRVQYFIDLSLQTFLREVFFYACSQLLEQQIRDYSVLNNPSYGSEKQRIMLGFITCLSDDGLYHWLYRQLADRVTKIRSECAGKPLYRYAYSKAIICAIDKAFHEIFAESRAELCRRLSDAVNSYPLHPDTARLVMDALNHVSKIGVVTYIEYVGKLLEEVAADVFMVRALNMRSHYLDYMLSSFDNLCAGTENVSVYSLLENTNERTRLSCLQAACMRRWPVPACLNRALAWRDKWFALRRSKEKTCQVRRKLISISEKQIETMRLTLPVNYVFDGSMKRDYILSGDWAEDCVPTPHDNRNRINHANRLRILNPGVTLGEYVYAIMNDPRYDQFFQKKENAAIVRRLRAFRLRRW